MKNNDSNGTLSVEMSFSRREDGMLEAAYIQFKKGEVAETRELNGTAVLGDYDRDGHLLGIEILAPIRFKDLVKYVETKNKAAFKRITNQRVCDLLEC